MGPITNPYTRKSNGALTNPYLRKTNSLKLSHTSTGSAKSNRSKISKSLTKDKKDMERLHAQSDMNKKDSAHSLSNTIVSNSLPTLSSDSTSRRIVPPMKLPKLKTPTKKNATVSYKAKLKREIRNLRKQKEQARNLKKRQAENAILEEERKQKLASKLQREKEILEQQKERQKMKEERRLTKLRLHEERKEKLVKDLEMRTKIEKEKVERKKLMLEEKEKAKLKKQQEREEKKHIEVERKRIERGALLRRQMTQYNPFYFPQVSGISNNQMQLYVDPAPSKTNQRQWIIPNSDPSNDLKNQVFQHSDAEVASAQVKQSQSDDTICSDLASCDPPNLNSTLSHDETSKSVIGTATINSNPLNSSTKKVDPCNNLGCSNESRHEPSIDSYSRHIVTAPRNVLCPTPSPFLPYQNISYAPIANGLSMQNFPATPVPYGMQMAHPNFYYPYSLSNFQRNNFVSNYPYSITHQPSVARTQKAVTNRMKRTSLMILHKDPLALPSPFVKSHHLLPFDIVIIKEGEESFGVELRYNSKGTLIALEPQLNKSISLLTSSVQDKMPLKPTPVSELALSNTLDGGSTTRSRGDEVSNGKETDDLTVRINNTLQSFNMNSAQSLLTAFKGDSEEMASTFKDRTKINVTCEEKRKTREVLVVPNDSYHSENKESVCLEDVSTTKSERIGGEKHEEFDRKILESRSKLTQCDLEPININRENGQMSSTSDNGDNSGTAVRLTHVSQNTTTIDPGFSTSSGDRTLEHQGRQISQVSDQEECSKSADFLTHSLPKATCNSQELKEPLQQQNGQNSKASIKNSECKKDSNPETTKPVTMVKPKRKRINVGVMSVLGATTQNKRALQGTSKEKLLQTGDIILAVNGESVSGMTFQEACTLFSKCTSETLTECSKTVTEPQKDGEDISNGRVIIRCTLKVAREKKVSKILDRLAALKKSEQVLPIIKNKATSPKVVETEKFDDTKPVPCKSDDVNVVTNIPFVMNETSNSVTSGEFTAQELRALVQSIKELELASLITVYDENYFVQVKALATVSLQHRYPSDILQKWVYETNRLDRLLFETAILSWKEDWASSQDSKVNTSINYIPNSHRSEMRSYPRPPRGCKCGGMDHNFVNDSKCFLYKNLFKFAPDEYLRMSTDTLSGRQKIETTGLGAIGSAHAHRLQKRIDERKAAELEGKFVNHMENIQISKLKMAIFAPNLHCVLVLSAIAEVAEQFQKQRLLMNINPFHHPNKRQKIEDEESSKPSLYCLAKILYHISKTWGHLYKEPGELEYAWAEECKVYDASDTTQFRFKTNPRQPGHFTYESFHFFLEKTFRMEELKGGSIRDESIIKEELPIVYFTSNRKTGLLHELSSLQKNGLVSINSHGFVGLSENWARKIHPIILKDMYESGWSRDIDPSNKFCVHPRIRNDLAEEWAKMDTGFKNKDDTLKHFDYDYEVKREIFESKFEVILNEQEGIAKFGI